MSNANQTAQAYSSSAINSPLRTQSSMSSTTSNSNTSSSTTTSGTTGKGSRSKGKSSAPGSKSNSTTSSPTPPTGNVLPKGIPTGPDAPPQICSNCQTTSTPLWRRDGKGGLCCNSCQLWAKTKGYPRPMSLKTDVIKPRIRQSKAGPKKKTKKQLAMEAAGGIEAPTGSVTSQKSRKNQSDGLISQETSPDPTNDRESSASSRSYSRSYSGSASPPPGNSGRASMESYHYLSHSQHLPAPSSGLHHSIHSPNSGVNLPSLSRLLAETGQQPPQPGGHQSAPSSHRPSLDGSSTGHWSPPYGDAEQEAAYALASRRGGKLPEGAYSSNHPHSHHPNQRTISRRGSVPSLFGSGGVGQHSSNVRGGESGSASASGESSPRSTSYAANSKTEDVSEYYSNMSVGSRPLPPLKRERDSESGVNIPGTSTHHSTSSLRASNQLGDRDVRGGSRVGPDGEALRFGVSPRSRADVDAGFTRGRPYSNLRDSETNLLFTNHGRYPLTNVPGVQGGGGSGPIGLSAHQPQSLERHQGVATGTPSTRPLGSRSQSQVPPMSGGGGTGHDYPSSRQGSAAPSSRSSSTGRVPMISGSSAARASSLSRIDSSSNHSSPRGSPFASPRGSPSRNMEPLPLNVSSHLAHHHHVGGGSSHPHQPHPHSYHPYASPNQSPLLNARDGLPMGAASSAFQQQPSQLSQPYHHQQHQNHNSAAAALDVLGAAASERLIDEGLTSRSTVTSTVPAFNQNGNSVSNLHSTSSPLNSSSTRSDQHPSTTNTSPGLGEAQQDPPRGRTGGPGGPGLEPSTSSSTVSSQQSSSAGPAMAAQEGSMYWARRGNAEGPALCSYHQTHSKTGNTNFSDDPIDSMDLDLADPPAHGAQPQLRYLDCGCSPDEALFEMACERRGIKGLDPKSRRNLLSLERKKNDYKEGDWEE